MIATHKSGDGVGAGVGGIGVMARVDGATCEEGRLGDGCNSAAAATASFKSQPVSSKVKKYVPAFN